ncbi:MAG TPA: cysteine dioxygenase [Usitatibacter sp.]|nr:cysteine dioxygenase [Usitatibacter sp.]
MTPPQRLGEFVAALTALVDAGGDEARIVAGCREAMQRLVARDDWLPEELAKPHPKYYQQYLLHCDPRDRFSVVSFVWGPGQKTPVHDHTVWGVIGMLRGAERCAPYRRDGNRVVPAGEPALLRPGDVDAVSPTLGDIHRVSNAYDDRVSISIHAYGANIGRVRRHVYDLETGAVKEFVSGYANA